MEQLPTDSPLLGLFALGEHFVSSLEFRGTDVEKDLTVYNERVKELVLRNTQFSDEASSFQFFKHVLSLPSEAQVSFFTTGITLDAISSNMKFQSVTSSAFILKSYSQEKSVKPSICSGESSSTTSRAISLFSSNAPGSASVSETVGRQFDKSPEKNELSSKAADFVFNNPVLYFVKNPENPSVLHAICATKEFLPQLSFSQKVSILA